MRCSFDWILERGSGGSNCMHYRAGTGVCMAMYSFRHRPPHQRRQGQAAPERHSRRSRQRRQGQHPRRLRDLGQIPPPPPPPRGGGAVSKRTYSPGQKKHVISVQHAHALAGAHARMSSSGMRVQSQARMRASTACMSMHACRAAAARFRRGRTRLDRRNT
jgi:hypothetical protein